MPFKDPEEAKKWRKRYYAANREKSIKNAHDWYHTHKHDPEVKARRYAQNERWKKGEGRNKEEGREVYLAARKRRYYKNKSNPKVQEANRRYSAKQRERTIKPLVKIAHEAKSGGCIYCDEKALESLDFHHRDPSTKLFSIGKTLYTGPKVEALKAEIAKCDVVCANCHIKHHLDEPSSNRKPATEKAVRGQKLRAKKKARWGSFIERAKAAGCSWCPESDPDVLHFHHLNPLAKIFEVMLYTFKPIRIDLPHEVEKCLVLCANCHRKAHNRARGEVMVPDLRAYWQDRLL